MRGYDFDGVVTAGVKPDPPAVIISGRTWAEWDDARAFLVQHQIHCPVYIRGTGRPGDRQHAARFKARMIALLGIEDFYEDDPVQASLIAARVAVHVHLVTVEPQCAAIVAMTGSEAVHCPQPAQPGSSHCPAHAGSTGPEAASETKEKP